MPTLGILQRSITKAAVAPSKTSSRQLKPSSRQGAILMPARRPAPRPTRWQPAASAPSSGAFRSMVLASSRITNSSSRPKRCRVASNRRCARCGKRSLSRNGQQDIPGTVKTFSAAVGVPHRCSTTLLGGSGYAHSPPSCGDETAAKRDDRGEHIAAGTKEVQCPTRRGEAPRKILSFAVISGEQPLC